MGACIRNIFAKITHAFHTPVAKSISATFESNPYQVARELQPSALSPLPLRRMMDYQSRRVSRRDVEEGGRREVTHNRDIEKGALGSGIMV